MTKVTKMRPLLKGVLLLTLLGISVSGQNYRPSDSFRKPSSTNVRHGWIEDMDTGESKLRRIDYSNPSAGFQRRGLNLQLRKRPGYTDINRPNAADPSVKPYPQVSTKIDTSHVFFVSTLVFHV